MLIGEWNGHEFRIDPDLFRSFHDLSIKTSAQTENKTSSSNQWVTYKSGGIGTISFKVLLNAFTGADVYNEAQAFLKEAHDGAKGYFYVGGNKLLPCKLMLTSCEVGNVKLTGLCQWTQAELSLTMQQCEKYGGEKDAAKKSSGGSGKSGGSGETTVKQSLDEIKQELHPNRVETPHTFAPQKNKDFANDLTVLGQVRVERMW